MRKILPVLDLNMTDKGSQSNRNQISVLYLDDEQDLLYPGKLFLGRSGEFMVDTMSSVQETLNSPCTESYNAIISIT